MKLGHKEAQESRGKVSVAERERWMLNGNEESRVDRVRGRNEGTFKTAYGNKTSNDRAMHSHCLLCLR